MFNYYNLGDLMELKCAWCNKSCNNYLFHEFKNNESSYKAFFCSLDHLEELQRFFKFAETHLKHFFLGLILPGIASILLVIVNLNALSIFVVLAGIGITIIIFPFTTPQTNELLGFKTAILLVRILGIILIGLGYFIGLLLK